ncbi:MAG: putative transporter [Bacteroidia bacterium]|nr:putative transporter [Bacteroidia bacterium]
MIESLFLPSDTPGVLQSLMVILTAIGVGVFAGRLRVYKVSLGVSGVMFAGLIMGHYGYRIQPDILDFVRDLGLILFVYGIGIQVGPSFFSSFRRDGLRFNLLAVGTVGAGILIAWLLYILTDTQLEYVAGIMSGAVTNTPGLGAARAVLLELRQQPSLAADPAVAYAITYPLGVVGVIIVIVAARQVFRIDLAAEAAAYEANRQQEAASLVRAKCRVHNSEVIGKTLFHLLREHQLTDVIISRLKHTGSQAVITPGLDITLQDRDVMVIVGQPQRVAAFVSLVGSPSTDPQIDAAPDIVSRSVFVTRRSAVHKSLAELNLVNSYGLKVTRVFRSGMELLARPDLELYYGDKLQVVGNQEDIESVCRLIGNAESRLLEPDFLSLFGGLIIGIVLGSVPIVVPGLPVPVRLGFAAGPLLAALLISRYGGVGVIHSYLNAGATHFMKDLGICLFFAAVGVHAGETFYASFVEHHGWTWLAYGSLITFIPLALMVAVGRIWLKINFLQLAGIISGAYTDPAALAFSTGYLRSDVPTQAYAAVYPLVTLCRIFGIQVMLLVLG